MKEKSNYIVLWVIRVSAFLGLFGAGTLSYKEWQTGIACPDIVSGLPACYVITGFFIYILLGSFWFPRAKSVLFISLGGVLFAGFATTQNILLGNICPVTSSGIPQCYIALTLFTVSSLGLWFTWYQRHHLV